jgi:hypothetical protein
MRAWLCVCLLLASLLPGSPAAAADLGAVYARALQ